MNELDPVLVRQEAYTESLEQSVDRGEMTDEQAALVYWNWMNNRSVVDPNQATLFD